jgi:hypothetical protein
MTRVDVRFRDIRVLWNSKRLIIGDVNVASGGHCAQLLRLRDAFKLGGEPRR